MEQSQKLTAAREAREAAATPTQKRNQKFLNHLTTFLEPIPDDVWHDFTIEVQTVANRYARKRPAPAATGVPPPDFNQGGGGAFQMPQQQMYGYAPSQTQGTFRTGSTPPSFPALPQVQQGYMQPSPGYPAMNTPQMPLSPSTTATGQSSTQGSYQAGAGESDRQNVMNILTNPNP